MFVETRTSVAEVLADVHAEVAYAANRVMTGARNRVDHPTYITKPQLRDDVNRMNGMYELAIQVSGGIDQLPSNLVERVQNAREAASKVL